MINSLAHLSTFSLFFDEIFFTPTNFLYLNDYFFITYLFEQSLPLYLNLTLNTSYYNSSITTFIQQLDDLATYNNNNIASIYHYSIPNTKLAYPEPFIASPSFMHSDLWFMHILVYQYWLWFVFVFIIIFFLITFICTVRWCNMRIRPRRETRGVSRSKCGDLITACVPVSWATSIIVNESTDAIDYYDGFGTTELVVGIRAYQWGWEYYYPKDIDLNYNIKPSYSAFIGNSLKYTKSSDSVLSANNFWKYYQNKPTDFVILPAHALVLCADPFKLINFFNFKDFGSNPSLEVNAFKKIRSFSKLNNYNSVFLNSNFTMKYKQISTSYITDLLFSDSYLYGIKRQHNFLTSNSIINGQSTFINLKSVSKLSTSANDSNSNDLFLNVESLLSNLDTSVFFKNKLKFLPLTDAKFDLISENSRFFNFKKSNLLDFIILNSNTSFLKDTDETAAFSKLVLSKTNNDLIGNQSNNFLTLLDLTNLIENSSIFMKTKNILLKTHFDYSVSPVISNYARIYVLNYQNNSTLLDENLPFMFNNLPKFTDTTAHYSFYKKFLNETLLFDWRYLNINSFLKLNQLSYLPAITLYYDYDFRNWQMFEFLEDAFWESFDSVYLYDEYLSICKEFNSFNYFQKFENFFNQMNRISTFQDRVSSNPLSKYKFVTGEFVPNVIYFDDNMLESSNISSKDFSIFPFFLNLNSLDDSYESYKFLNYIFDLSYKSFFITSLNSTTTHTSAHVFDYFRSDVDDFSWFYDEGSVSMDAENLNLDLNFFSNIFTNIFDKNLDLLELDSSDSFLHWYINMHRLYFNLHADVLFNFSTRFSNNLSIRNSVKNSIVTYNAIQKVFRTRFDEGRSNAKLNDFSHSFLDQAYITSSRISYEKLLGKNKETFFQTNLYKSVMQPNLNNLYFTISTLNYYYFDFPFLLALKSDASRYLWFDWYAKWGFYEVQPSSSSRYAIYGMPFLAKNFEFNASQSDLLTESETYFLRLSRARRNYLPNWVYNPYFYTRNTTFFKNNFLFEALGYFDSQVVSAYCLMQNSFWYWTGSFCFNLQTNTFNPSNSGINSYARLGWRPQSVSSSQSYYYTLTNLTDILTKREYLFREFFFNNNNIISLPSYLTNTPSNPLINDLKASFLFIDPSVSTAEYSRDCFVNSLNYYNFVILKTFFKTSAAALNLNFLPDYLFYYFFNDNSLFELKNANTDLYKSQYRPLKKGITNMIRLHATGAIALPIEIRLQILASSKDVIHSWAVPSAGIKIDCVPGYSSHKVMIFLVSGIFWGQCMEICGRYHHWMPIIVYFMKRDLFFLWCTHFVFLSGSDSMWSINDRQYTMYARPVSFDKTVWLNEF